MRQNRKLYRQGRLKTLTILILGLLLIVVSGSVAENREVDATARRTLAGVEALKADASVNAENQQKIYAAILKSQEDIAKTLSIVCTGADPLRKMACDQAGVTGTETGTVGGGVPTTPPVEPIPAESAVTG